MQECCLYTCKQGPIHVYMYITENWFIFQAIVEIMQDAINMHQHDITIATAQYFLHVHVALTGGLYLSHNYAFKVLTQ